MPVEQCVVAEAALVLLACGVKWFAHGRVLHLHQAPKSSDPVAVSWEPRVDVHCELCAPPHQSGDREHRHSVFVLVEPVDRGEPERPPVHEQLLADAWQPFQWLDRKGALVT